MSDRKDLEDKLAASSEWVRDEFSFIVGLASELGCDVHLESGPGFGFRIGGQTIARAHPKSKHIGIGLPDWMRPDIQALTGALREQRGFAWFNYTPGVADRETIELLLVVSRDWVMVRRPDSPAPVTVHDQPLPSGRQGPARDDDADLTLILAVLQAFRRHSQTTGSNSAIKPIREAIFFQWEGPRLPPGGKYSTQLPHSPAARAQRRAGRHDGLVYEHVVPIAQVVRALLAQVPANTGDLRAELEATNDRVIITRSEDALLTAAGMRDRAPDANAPWTRYQAIGLSKDDFKPSTAP